MGAAARAVGQLRRLERLDALVSSIEQEGGKAMAVAMDVNDAASIAARSRGK